MPAPFNVTALLIVRAPAFQVALPAETLIVLPVLAFAMQVAILPESGVLVHVGVEPVQAAVAGRLKAALSRIINGIHFRGMVIGELLSTKAHCGIV
jgi:hypothetical protein